ncbi:hypothetical protein ACTND8_11965 [Atopobiaceae bacterium HCP3S3_F7]
MGFFPLNKTEQIDQEVIDRCLIGRYKDTVRSYIYCMDELKRDDLSNIERMTLEVNKQKTVTKAIKILDQLEHKEVISVEDNFLISEKCDTLEITKYIVTK